MNINLEKLKTKNHNLLLSLKNKLKLNDKFYLNKKNLIFQIVRYYYNSNKNIIAQGVLEIISNKYGFLRSSLYNYIPNCCDIYVSNRLIKKFYLYKGDYIIGCVSYNFKNKYLHLFNILSINYIYFNKFFKRLSFNDLTSIYPKEKIKLENLNIYNNLSLRIIDIISPIGKGQRALIVSPPKTGKTTLIQDICYSITINYPSMYILFLLIGERPEEVTDSLKSINCEVVSSTFDESSYRHVQLSEIILEKAKRISESNQDVIILLDSITKLVRSYNEISPNSGKTLSGGINSNALNKPKKFFGAARNFYEGGSLTIIATALVNTGSKMDDIIFEEFKGTGNCEIVLSREISKKKIFPAIDIINSGTRKDDLLFDNVIFLKLLTIKKIFSNMCTIRAINLLINKINSTKNNKDFLNKIINYE